MSRHSRSWRMKAVLLLALIVLLTTVSSSAGAGKDGAKRAPGPELSLPSGKPGQPPLGFTPMAGQWSLSRDAGDTALLLDGRSGPRTDYPYAVANSPSDFRGGTITLRFKGLSGKEDQAAGILFNLGPAGDYYALRANCLEDNLILWAVKGGRRSEVKSITVPVPAAGQWHELKLVVQGNRVFGFLNGKQYLIYDLPAPISGKVGIWSKSDSHMLFNGFSVSPN